MFHFDDINQYLKLWLIGLFGNYLMVKNIVKYWYLGRRMTKEFYKIEILKWYSAKRKLCKFPLLCLDRRKEMKWLEF